MNIIPIKEAEFDLLREEWNALLDRSAADCVFLRWEWIHTWWDIFRKKRKLFILTVRQDGRLVGAAPFFIEPAAFPKPRCLRFCSDELSPDYMDLILEKGQEGSATREIVRYVLSNAGEWDILCLDNLRAGSTLLADGLYDGLAYSTQVSFSCPYIPIQGTFDDYIRSRTNLATFELDKKHKRFFQKPEVRHFVVKDLKDLSRSIDDLFALRKMRSASKGMQSSFVDGDVKRFHYEISRHFLKEGILNLRLIYDHQTPVSAGYAFNYKKRVYFFQTAFDPQYKKWSAGGLVFRLVVQQAFAEGIIEFDTLKGNEAYKFMWSDAAHDEMNLTVYNRSLRGQGWRRLRRLKNALRRVKKKILKDPP
jgi:CelD/BcsL family acetyltransferase involved in cellulose biosynthesis